MKAGINPAVRKPVLLKHRFGFVKFVVASLFHCSLRRRRFEAGQSAAADEFRDGNHFHLGHYPAAVDFHGVLADPHGVGDGAE